MLGRKFSIEQPDDRSCLIRSEALNKKEKKKLCLGHTDRIIVSGFSSLQKSKDWLNRVFKSDRHTTIKENYYDECGS